MFVLWEKKKRRIHADSGLQTDRFMAASKVLGEESVKEQSPQK